MFEEYNIYKETQSIAKVGGWSFDIASQSVFWTNEVFEILELPKDITPDFEYATSPYLPDSRQLLLNKIEGAIQRGESYDLELQLKTYGTHKLLWVRAIGKPKLNETGEVVQLSGIIQDITPIKETSIKLEESQMQLNSVFEGVELGLWDWRSSEKIFISEQVPEIIGYPAKDFKSNWEFLQKIILAEDIQNIIQNMDNHVEKGVPFFDINFRVYDKKRRIKWLHVKGKVIEKDDKGFPTRITGTVQNITGLKKNEEERKRLISALELSSDAFAIVNSKHQYVYLNKAHFSVLGYEKDDLLGRKWTTIYDRKEINRIQKEIFPELEAKGKWSGEAVAKKKNGEVFHQSLTLTLMNDNSIISTFKANIKAKRTEQMLRSSKEKAERETHAKTDFLSTMSHELRTPLNAVVGITKLLLKNETNKEQLERLQVLEFSTNNLMSLINDILDYNKIEEGKIDFENIEFSLSQLVKQIKETHQIKANEKGLKLQLNLDKRLPKVVIGDPVRLSQVLNNLINNAIKFTKKGGVHLNIDLQDQNEEDVHIHFLVKDTGVGIPKEKQSLIFNRFEQGGVDITRKFGGSGLGLAITRRLLNLQGSKIKLVSHVGQGSSFSFSLKFKNCKDQQVLEDFDEDLKILKDLHEALILVVEDNPVNSFLVKGYLQQWNSKQEFAENGVIAVKKAREKKYDFILMDLQMPEMDGIEATKHIKEKSLNQNTPIIALTAATLPNIKKQVYEAGMVECLFKPFDADDLYRKIKKHLVKAAPSIPAWLNGKLDTPSSSVHLKEEIVKTAKKTQLFTLDKFLAVFNEDKEVQKEFLEITIKEFQTFIPKYSEAVRSFNEAAVRKLRHRMNPNLDILEFKALIEELNNTRKHLMNNTFSQLDADKSAQSVKQLSEAFINYATKYKEKM